MKKTLIIFILACVNLLAFGQDDDVMPPEPNGNVRQKINAARVAYISERLELTPEESEKFWPVYREYNQKRKDLRQQYRSAKKSGQDEKILLDLDLKIRQQELDLEKDYSPRLLAIIPAQKLSRLRDAEQDFRKLLLRQIEQRQQRGGVKRQRFQQQGN